MLSNIIVGLTKQVFLKEKKFATGTQSVVYSGDDKFVYKITGARDVFIESTLSDLVDGIVYFNDCFPEIPYEIFGFGEKDDKSFGLVTRQSRFNGYTISYIAVKEHGSLEKWVEEECRKAMLSCGFIEKGHCWMSPDEKYIIHDRTLFHEVQHAIQYREGFALGTSIDVKGYNDYAGEVDSRNAEKRSDMTPEQRRNTLLEETEDVPRSKQIVRFGSGVKVEMGSNTLRK